MTTPARIESADPAAYRRKMADLLGDRDPIDVLSRTGEALLDIVTEHSREQMCARPYEGKWTPAEIMGHLIDAEWVYGYRLRTVLFDERPQIINMDQELWVTGQRYNDADPRALVEMFRHLRGYNMVLWTRLTNADLKRVGVHNERGEESVETMRLMIAGHDLSHLDQIRRYLDAFTTD